MSAAVSPASNAALRGPEPKVMAEPLAATPPAAPHVLWPDATRATAIGKCLAVLLVTAGDDAANRIEGEDARGALRGVEVLTPLPARPSDAVVDVEFEIIDDRRGRKCEGLPRRAGAIAQDHAGERDRAGGRRARRRIGEQRKAGHTRGRGADECQRSERAVDQGELKIGLAVDGGRRAGHHHACRDCVGADQRLLFARFDHVGFEVVDDDGRVPGHGDEPRPQMAPANSPPITVWLMAAGRLTSTRPSSVSERVSSATWPAAGRAGMLTGASGVQVPPAKASQTIRAE